MCVTIHEVGEKPVITGWTDLSSDFYEKGQKKKLKIKFQAKSVKLL